LIRIGTRGSALAMAQASWVAARLGQPTQLVPITVSGDRDAVGGDKSRWVAELERALADGEIDVAVHSAKDVPSELAPGLELAAFPPRADPRDVICGARSLEALPPGARVGTSSLRRTAQLRALRDDIEVVAVRGNVDTRLRKLAAGELDALVLARAGLERLGRAAEAGAVLERLVPAAGQGALALEARAGAAFDGVHDRDTGTAVAAERELVRALGASCHTPVGAHARVIDGDRLQLRTWVGLPDGSAWISDRLTGPADGLGATAAERLLAVGAGELLRRAEREAAA
jgi:hydroxymethylbilane synthase